MIRATIGNWGRRVQRTMLATAWTFCFVSSTLAHNLDTRATSIHYADDFIGVMGQRASANQGLVQVGDEFWVVIKTTPGPGTTTGVGGYQTFYVPPWAQVVDAAYVFADGADPRGFREIPMKGQSPIAIGAGPVGAKSTPELIGYSLPGLNGLDAAYAPVTAAGLHRGTIAGVYADTGIFYSADPRTAFNSFGAAVTGGAQPMRNNSGDTVGEWDAANVVDPTVLGVMTLWDSYQLRAYGRADVAPVIDYVDGRGNTPWGLGNVVAGPQSGYAWEFDYAAFTNTSGTTAQKIQSSIKIGPWQRIRYPGSQISQDQPGLISSSLGYAAIDASTMGYGLDPATPLPADTKAVRFAIGQLELGRPELSAVKIKILSEPSATCAKIYGDAFGGDAGGTDSGKDHIWRYFDPTVVSLSPCTLLQKTVSKSLVAAGETFYYTIMFANNGTVALPNITLTDTLPSGMTFLSCVPPPTSSSPPVSTWNLGTVQPNTMIVITNWVKATSTGTLFNDVTARSGTEVIASADQSVEVGARAILEKSKTATPSAVAAGGTVTYTITVSNVGTGLNGVPLIVRDYLPQGFTFLALTNATLNGAAIASPTVTVGATDPSIASFTMNQGIQAGKTLTLTFTARAGATVQPGTYHNNVELLYEGKRQPPIPEAPVTVAGGKIGDTIFYDWTNFGTWDSGEEGLSNIAVSLYKDADTNGSYETFIGTQTTDASGLYLFTGLTAGNYQVAVPTSVGDFLLSADPNGLPATTNFVVTLGIDEARLDADFGYRFNAASTNSAQIGDMVYADNNKDGMRDLNEVGVTNVTVWLYEDTNGNGVRDSGDLLAATTATSDGLTMDADADGEIDRTGFYVFQGLDPDKSYIVMVDQTDSDLTAFFDPNPYTISTPGEVAVSAAQLLPGERYADADFGFFGAKPASLGDLVYYDANRNGVFDAGDSPLPNVTVQLYLDENGNGIADEPVMSTAVTDLSGNYLFSDLGSGDFIVKVLAGDTDIPAGASGTVAQYNVALNPGDAYLSADFPFVSYLDKAVDRSYEAANGILTYTIAPYVPGALALTNVLVADAVPDGTTYYGNAAPAPTSQPAVGGTGNVQWSLGTTVAAAHGAGVTPGYKPTAITRSTTAEADDTYVSMANGTTWYGGGNELVTRPANASSIKAALMKFTLPTLAANDVVDRAVIRLMVRTARTSNHTVTLRRVKTSWTEGTSSANGATWNDSDGTGSAGDWLTTGIFGTNDYDTTVSYGSYNAPYATGQTLEFDVTDLVRAWRSGTVANNGVVLVASGTDAGDLKFYSSETATAATPGPGLVVCYSTSGSGTYTVRDPFATVAYNNNDGTMQWAGGWLETGDGGSPSAGNILVTGGRLRVKDSAPVSIYRSVNLSETTNAVLSLDMANNTLDSTSDVIALEASVNGGASWMRLDSYTLGTAAFTGKTFNLISLLGSVNKDTRIRFIRISNGGKTGKSIDFDNVQISYTTPAGGTTTTRLAADTALLSGTRNVTVSLTVLSDVSANVTPPANLTVTATGTASATQVSGPTPASGRADSIGGTFSYIYQVAAGSGIGSVRFSGAPTGPAGFTFGTGASQTVLTTAPLTFQAKVNDPAPTPGPVTNTASLTASASLSVQSPQAYTATTGSIGDRVWLDADADGVQDANEVGVAGVRVNVYLDANMDGVPDGAAVGTALTAMDGSYHVQGLSPGNYLVSYDFSTVPGGYAATTPGTLSVYGLTAGQQYTAADFGLQPAGGGEGSIGDTLWIDADNDGMKGEGEGVLTNVTMVLEKLVSGVWTEVAATVTGTNGAYVFTGLADGDYRVSVNTNSLVASPNSGDVFPLGASAAPTYDLNGTNTPHQATVTLNSTQRVYDTLDFGYNWTGSIGDFIWYDTNGNGLQDETDYEGGPRPAPNATAVLYADFNGNGVVDEGEGIVGYDMTCDGSPLYPCQPGQTPGHYLFENLPPGDYIVFVSEQEIPSPVTGNNNVMVHTVAEKLQVTLGVGAGESLAVRDIDFGLMEATKVGGHVYWDVNHNGLRDGGETLFTNVTVVLTGFDHQGQPVSITNRTDAFGTYVFVAPPGDYTLTYLADDVYSQNASVTAATTPLSINLSVQAGVEYSGNDFGRDDSGTLGDTVFADTNGTPGQQAGEAGLADVTVRLYANPDNSSALNGDETLLEVALTDATGNYMFTGLADGYYLVQASTNTLPAGYSGTPATDPNGAADSQGTATIMGGNAVLTLDFGYPAQTTTYSVSGTIYGDNGAGGGTAGNGTQDGTEPGLAGVAVTISVNGVLYTVTTDASGNYTLSGVPAGATVIVTTDTGTLPSSAYVQTGDPDATLDNSNTFTMPAANVPNKNFGYQAQYGSISGKVVDGDGDGVAETGESPLANVTVTLLYAGADGIFGTEDDSETNEVTAADGSYSFTGLVPGNYRVAETDPSGTVSLADADGGNPNIISVAGLLPNQNVVARDFEDTQPNRYLGDRLWLDLDNDGVQDAGEPGISNVTVRLYSAGADGILGSADDALVASDTTDALGEYKFESLAPATYRVAVDTATLPAGYVAHPTFDLDGVGTDSSAVVELDAGAGRLDVDFGYYPRAVIGNLVWEDLDGNGVQDGGEPGLTNVTVRLYDSVSNLVASVQTDTNGVYAFTNLLPGTYYVQTVPPTGYTNTLVQAGGDSSLDSDMNAAGWSGSVTVISGETRNDVDSGMYLPALLKGYVFKDRDADMIRDTDDGMLTNVLVRLMVDGVVIASTNTDATGYYQFDNVPLGTVSVMVSRVDATLSAVPESSDERRNRALADTEGLDAVIVFNVTSGYGVLAERPAETLNFGFSLYPLSTAIDISLYATANGVMIEVWTVNESGYDDIVIFAWIGNAWVEVGRVPSWQIVGEGANRYTVQATGLAVGRSYTIKIVDEAGHVHVSPAPVAVLAIRVEAVRLDMETLTVSFNTEQGRRYVVQVSTDLMNWTPEYISYPTADGWSEFTDEAFTAGGARIEVRVPVNGRSKAFFKVVMAE